MTTTVARVSVTPEAADLLRRLRATHGPLMFHQSGGCCDGSAPMCYLAGEFRTGGADVRVSVLHIDGIDEPIEFWMSAGQFEYYAFTHTTLDAVPGRGGSFSLEAPEGMRFLIRSRLFTDEEVPLLEEVRAGGTD